MNERSLEMAILPDLAPYAVRERASIVGVVVHRIEVSQEDATYHDSPSEILKFFREHPIGKAATGGKMPYPILIAASGEATQLLPLSCVTPHARSHNPTTIAVAAIGDFRRQPPSDPQRRTLVLICAELLHTLGRTEESLFGHDELADGSADPNKECPGRHLNLSSLRRDVADAMRRESFGELTFVW